MYFSGIEEIPYTYLIHFIEINASRPWNREDTYLSHSFYWDRRPDRLLYLENFKKTNSFQKFCKVIRKGVKNVCQIQKDLQQLIANTIGKFSLWSLCYQLSRSFFVKYLFCNWNLVPISFLSKDRNLKIPK